MHKRANHNSRFLPYYIYKNNCTGELEVKMMIEKIKKWLNTVNETSFVNDEGDEIVSCFKNKDMLFGFIGGFMAIFAAAVLSTM